MAVIQTSDSHHLTSIHQRTTTNSELKRREKQRANDAKRAEKAQEKAAAQPADLKKKATDEDEINEEELSSNVGILSSTNIEDNLTHFVPYPTFLHY